MTCQLLESGSPFNAASVVCSALGLIITSLCLLRSFSEWNVSLIGQSESSSKSNRQQTESRNLSAIAANPDEPIIAPSPSSFEANSPSTSRDGPLRSRSSPLWRRWLVQFRAYSRPLVGQMQAINFYLRVMLKLSWIILFFESLSNLLFVCAVIWLCPQHNCKSFHVFRSGTCVSGASLHSQIVLQPVAAAFFCLATMNRFIGVYSILSTWRYRLLRLGSLAVMLVTAFRIGAISVRSPSFYAEYVDARWFAIVNTLDDISYYVTWSLLGLLEVMSLAIGLHHVLTIRAELRSAMSMHQGSLCGSSPTFEIPDHVKPPQQPLNSPLRPQGTTSGHPFLKKNKGFKLYRTQSNRVLACIALNAVLLLIFLVMNVPTVRQSTPATFMFTFMTLFLKIFAASTTVAIHVMTDFVVSGSDTSF